MERQNQPPTFNEVNGTGDGTGSGAAASPPRAPVQWTLDEEDESIIEVPWPRRSDDVLEPTSSGNGAKGAENPAFHDDTIV